MQKLEGGETKMRMLEGVTVPEFFVTHVGKTERLHGCVRFYVCTQEDGILIPAYRAIWPVECLMGKPIFRLTDGVDDMRAH